jgi:hypothetical protein
LLYEVIKYVMGDDAIAAPALPVAEAGQ